MRQAAAIALGQTGHAKVTRLLFCSRGSVKAKSGAWGFICTFACTYAITRVYISRLQMIHDEIANRLSNSEEAIRLDALKKVLVKSYH